MDIHQLGLLEVSEKIRRRELTAEAVTEALLARIARHEDRLHSIALLMADSARAQARQADAEIAAGRWRGPLHGVPIGIKDLLWTKGLPTTAGMELLGDFRPDADATVVALLKAAGAVLIAKLRMTEGAMLAHHPALPTPVSPWSAAHWTGTSSSGSGVAAAAGFCFAAIGSDTGGSIRLPSSANNLTGIKPTWGRVSRFGVMPLSESLDHVGPMARSAADAAAVLQAIAGRDPHDPTSLADPVPDYLGQMQGGVAGLTLGVDPKLAQRGLADEIVAAMESAVGVFERLGMTIKPAPFDLADADAGQALAVLMAELALAHAAYFPAQADRYGPSLRGRLEDAQRLRAADVAAGYVARDRFRGKVRALFDGVDLLLTPGLGRVVPRVETIEAMIRDEIEYDAGISCFAAPFNVAGVPTLSLPGGFTGEGLPVGVQLVGPWLAEPALIRAGVAFQQASDFHTRRPPLDA
jgi:amidase